VHNSPKLVIDMVKIVILGLNACLGSAFLGTLDAFRFAARAIAAECGGAAPFEWLSASIDGAPASDGEGRRLPVDAAIERIAACDAIVVPSFDFGAAGAPVDLPGLGAAAAFLRRHHARGALACASGSGVFLLGEAGLLDGRRCVTSKDAHDELKRRFPRALPIWGAPLIEERRVVTAGAPLAFVDMALHVIGALCGATESAAAAEALASGGAPAHAAPRPGALEGPRAFLMAAERVVRQALDRSLSTQELAQALSTSERTLHRRLKLASGDSPKSFIDRVRVDAAKSWLESSARSVKELSASAGFGDEASFRRTFRRFVGMAPGAYRDYARARGRHAVDMFALRKDADVIPELLKRILDCSVTGVTLADPDLPDSPIVYANARFLEITGYSEREVLGRNCRMLQGDDRDQEGLKALRRALENREHVEVTLRNYRKDGALFHNRLHIAPLFDEAGRLLYFLGVQYDATAQMRAELEIADLRAQLHALLPAGT
jgi:PAS domain S-box-containing protein